MARDEVQTDPDYFLWSLRGEPQVLRPHVLAVDRDGRTESMLVARLSQVRLPCKVRYTTVYAPVVRALSVVHEGLLGLEDDVVADAVLDELFAGLDQGDADVLLFRQIRRDSRLRDAAQARSGFLTRQRIARTDLRWRIELPATFDEYLASLSSGTRKSIRRTATQVENALGAGISIRSFREVADLDEYLRDAESVAARTYQRSLGVGFLDDERQRARVRMLMDHGWFRSYVLYLDGTPDRIRAGRGVPGPVRLRARGLRPGVRQPQGRCVPAREGDRGSDRRPAALRVRLRARRRRVQAQARAPEHRGGRSRRLRAARKADPDQPRPHWSSRGVVRRHDESPQGVPTRYQQAVVATPRDTAGSTTMRQNARTRRR